MSRAANILVADAGITIAGTARPNRNAAFAAAHAPGAPAARRGKHFRQEDQPAGAKPRAERRTGQNAADRTDRLGPVPAGSANQQPAATDIAAARPMAARPEVASTKATPARDAASAASNARPSRSATTTPATQRPRPTVEQLRSELAHERSVRRAVSVTRSTVYALVVVAAVAVLVATLFFPVFRIYGTSMNPTFTEGDIVVATSGGDLSVGDPVVFYYENKVLVKRYIAGAGQWVDIDDDGNVYVDGERLDEPYVSELALGECDIELPYQVPDGRIFVLGDNRATSVDSRSTTVGCVSEEQLVGKIVFRVWPLSGFGTVE